MTVQDVTERDRHAHDVVPALMAPQSFHAGMEAVVACAGCLKQTPDNRYGPERESIQHCHAIVVEIDLRALEQPFRQWLVASLLTFATMQQEHSNGSANIDAIRLLTARAGQFPVEAPTAHCNCITGIQEHPVVWQEPAKRQRCLRHDDPHYATDPLSSMITGTDLGRRRLFIPSQSKGQQHRTKSAVDSLPRAFASPLSSFPIEINRNLP